MSACKISDTKLPTEHAEQVTLIQWYQRAHGDSLLFSIPNGGLRNRTVAGKLKAEGVVPGVPDLLLAKARHGHHGLWIEMKRQKGGRVSPEQRLMMAKLSEQGYRCVVCPGYEAARAEIEAYLATQ